MKTTLVHRRWFHLLLVATIGVTLILLSRHVPTLPGSMGKIDFRAYWSASYLLSQGEDFSSKAGLLRVQREATSWEEDYAMKTWNPPWVLVWLLPYAALDFERASTMWLLTNVVLLTITVAGSWRLFYDGTGATRSLSLPILAAALFPSTVVSLLFGQSNMLVAASIVVFLLLFKARRYTSAGMALAFATSKPHLAYLTFPVIFVYAIKCRGWGVLLGFLSVLSVSLAVAIALRPMFPMEYLQSNSGGNLLAWENSTLVTYLSLKSGWIWIRLIGAVLLPLVPLFYWRFSDQIRFITAVEISLFLSLITAPFGWSYDFVVLLLPLTHSLYWIAYRLRSHFDRIVLIMVLLFLFVVYYLQRIGSPSELYYYWVPMALAAVYAWTWYRTGADAHEATADTVVLDEVLEPS